MISRFLVLLLLFAVAFAQAEDVDLSDVREGKPLPGSKSPDEKYCLLEAFHMGTSACSVIIADTRQTKNFGKVPVKAEPSSGLAYKGRTSIVWNPDSKRFAVHDASGKHSKVSVYRLVGDGFELAETGDIFAAACNHFGIRRDNVVSSGQQPVKWPAGDALEVEVSLKLKNGKTLRHTLAVQVPLQVPAPPPVADDAPRLIRISEENRGPGSPMPTDLVAEVKGDTAESRQLIDDLWTRHRQSFPEGERMYYGPDAGYTQIELVRGKESIVIGSWHTVERTSPQLFAGHQGLAALGNRTREQALAAEPESYQRFRKSFDAIHDAVTKFMKR